MSKKIELPLAITALVKAQNEYDSSAFSTLFAENAIVHDEGKVYEGRTEIKFWNEETNNKYRVTLEPIEFCNNEKQSVLIALVTGNFDGSPIPMKYNLTFEGENIKTLNIDV